MLAISLLRVVFDAWHSVAVDARKTKEYFEVRNSGRALLKIHTDRSSSFFVFKLYLSSKLGPC